MQTASVTLKKVTLELDGNDPAVVFPNANILKEAAPKIFQRAAMNNGQVSVAIMRDFLHGNQYDEMIATLKEEAGS